jgi:hypothetical protein
LPFTANTGPAWVAATAVPRLVQEVLVRAQEGH